MADFFKGLSGGFQTGMQLGQAVRQRRKEDELAQVYARPEEFTDYTPEQQRQIQGLQTAGGYDVQAVPGAEGAAPTLRYTAQPSARYYDDMGQPEAPIEIAPQRVQRYGGQTVAGQFDPTQLRGLQMQEAARVLGSYGDVRGAAALQAQADEQAYQARIRPMQEEQLRGSIASQAQQGLLTAGQIKAMNKAQERDTKLESVDADVAQWQSKRLLDPNTNEARQPTMDDNIAALQYRAAALQKAGLAKEATDSLRDYQGFAVNQIKLDETQRNSQLGAVAAAIAAGDLTPAVAFYDRYVLDGAKVTGMKTDPKTGAITVSRVRDDGGKLPDKVIKGGANELLASLNSFRDPMSLYNFSQNEFTNNLNLRKTVATEQTAKATVGLTDARKKALEKDSATMAKLDAIDEQIAALTPEEASGPKGRGLLTQRNAIVAGATKQVTVPAAGRAERPALSEADATARAKAMVEAREVDSTGKRLTFTEALDVVRGTPPAPGTPASDSATLKSLIGSGKDPFATDTTAGSAPTRAPSAAPAPARSAPVATRQTGSMGIDPSRPRTDVNPVTGLPREAPAAAPNLVDATARGLDAAQARYVAYLRDKIAARERLTPDEAARAKRFGLVP